MTLYARGAEAAEMPAMSLASRFWDLVKRPLWATASLFVLYEAVGAIWGLANGISEVAGSAAIPYRLHHLAVETMARESWTGLRWGLIWFAVFAPYGFAAWLVTRKFRRGAIVMAYSVFLWFAGIGGSLFYYATRYDKELPVPYRNMMSFGSFLLRWVAPRISDTACTEPGKLIENQWALFAPFFLVGALMFRLTRRWVSERPLRWIPSLAIGKRSGVSCAILLAATAVLAFMPWAFPRPSGKPNVLLVSIDTLRADGLHCYGNPRPTSPVIDALAADGVRYENYYSNAPWTLPGHASMLTGLIPDVHGVTELNRSIPRQAPLLAELFKNSGYSTFAVAAIYLVSPFYGFDRGFDAFAYRPEAPAAQIAQTMIDRLPRLREPWFMFVHFYDPHLPYKPTEEARREFNIVGPEADQIAKEMQEIVYKYIDTYLGYDAAKKDIVRALYDAEIRDVDRSLGRILQEIDKRFDRSRTIVVVTSDHGEEMGEHGWFGHSVALYAESLHIPLILSGPGVPRGEVRRELCGMPLLAPQILDLAGVRDPLKRDWRKIQASGDAYASTSVWGPPRYSWRRGIFSLLSPAEFTFGERKIAHPAELFADSAERVNLLPQEAQRATQMQSEMEHFVGGQLATVGAMKAAAVAMDPARRQRLKDLGYLN